MPGRSCGASHISSSVGKMWKLLWLSLICFVLVAQGIHRDFKAKRVSKSKKRGKKTSTAPPLPPPYLCASKSLALTASYSLLPGCRIADVPFCLYQRQQVYTDLELSLCGIDFTDKGTDQLGSEEATPVPDSSAPVYYVSPTGSDSNSGLSSETPFQTIQKALNVVGALNEKYKVIAVLPGTYYISETLVLGPQHSGLSIVGKSASSGLDRPTLSSSVILDDSNCPWTAAGNGLIKCQLTNDVLSQLDKLSMLFVNGQGAVRARFPDIPDPLSFAYETTKPTRWGKGKPLATTLLINRIIPPADDPTTSFQPGSPAYNIFTLGYAVPTNNSFNPPVSYFINPKAEAEGGCPYTLPTSATFASKKFSTWANPQTGLFNALQWEGWGVWNFEIASQTPTEIVFGKGGWQETRGDCGKGGSYYYIENVYELLDFPNEFFLSQSTGELYYYPSSTAQNPLVNLAATVEITTGLKTILQIQGQSSSPVSEVSIQNIELFGAYTTTMENFLAPSGGDYSIYPGAALSMTYANNILIQDNTFSWCGGNALSVLMSGTEIMIQRNDFFAIGGTAVVVVGDPGFDTPDPWVIKNYPTNVTITGNVASFFGLSHKLASATFLALTANVAITENVFYHGPRSAFSFNDQFGGNKTVLRNLVFDLVRETSDQGPLILWNRQPYQEARPPPDVFDRNFFFGQGGLFVKTNGGGSKGIDLDDGAFNSIVSNNVVIQGFQKIKGSWNNMYNNLLVYPPVWGCGYISYYTRIPSHLFFTDNTCISDVPPYSFGLTRPALVGVCSTTNLVTRDNTFYYYGTKTNLGGCAKSWAHWTKTMGQDMGSNLFNNQTSEAQIAQWILERLNWIPV